MLTTRITGYLIGFLLITPVAFALDDPTRPPDFRSGSSAPAEVRTYSLDSILIGPARRAAVIDGKTRTEGERFGGVRLVKIHADKVELNDQGQLRVLHWKMPPQVRSSR